MSDSKNSKNNKNAPVFSQKPRNLQTSLEVSKREVQRNSQLPILKPHEREVQPLSTELAVLPLEPKYTNLLQAPQPKLGFKEQMLAVGAILIFSIFLAGIYTLNQSKDTKGITNSLFGQSSSSGAGRGVSGELNDLSNGAYTRQAADYSEEKVCTDHSDGTKTCTTRTKLRREFR